MEETHLSSYRISRSWLLDAGIAILYAGYCSALGGGAGGVSVLTLYPCKGRPIADDRRNSYARHREDNPAARRAQHRLRRVRHTGWPGCFCLPRQPGLAPGRALCRARGAGRPARAPDRTGSSRHRAVRPAAAPADRRLAGRRQPVRRRLGDRALCGYRRLDRRPLRACLRQVESATHHGGRRDQLVGVRPRGRRRRGRPARPGCTSNWPAASPRSSAPSFG